MDKHNLKKEEIINIAFSEWGKTNFKNISLSSISKKMKLTKAALYRYFENKDELFEELKNYFLLDLVSISNSIINNSYNNIEEYLKIYINSYLNFFIEKHYYLFFLMILSIKENLTGNKIIYDIKNKEKAILLKLIDNQKNNILNEQNIELFLNYIFGTIIIIMIELIKNKETHKEYNVEQLISTCNNILLYGFAKKKDIVIDFDKIENNSKINKTDILERDKFFDAVTQVISEYGIWDASLDKIAKKLSLSKSTLYFYFKNKQDMFVNVIFQEINKINQLVLEKQKYYSNFFEKFYCHITVLFNYFLLDIRIVNFFNWIHLQGFDLKKNIKNKNDLIKNSFSYLNQAQENNLINCYIYDIDFFERFLNVHLIREIVMLLNNNLISNKNIENQYKITRFLYNIILFGIKN